MAAGGLAYRAARLGALGLLGRLGEYWGRGLSGRAISALAATVVEAPVFTQTARFLEPHPGDFAMGTLSAGLMMGTLRSFGFLGQGAVKLAAGSVAAPWIPWSFQLAGLHFHHSLEKRLGLVDPKAPEPGLSGYLGTLVQFHGMGLFMRGALGASWAAAERAAEIKMETQIRASSLGAGWGEGRSLAAVAGPAIRGRGTLPSEQNWAIIRNFEEAGPRDSAYKMAGGMFEGPAIETPRRVFLWLWQNLLRTESGVFFIELGSQKNLKDNPEAREVLKTLEAKIREAFADTTWDSQRATNGLLSEILREYPGILWHIKKQLSQPGYKVWLQMDADEGKLWNLALLDGIDRPRHMLMTLPLGEEALELKVDYQGSGLPVMEGVFFKQEPSVFRKIKSRIIENVVNYPGGKGLLDSTQVQREVFRQKQFHLEARSPKGMGLNITYQMGDRAARWEWSVPGFGSTLVLKTRYEDYRPPRSDPPRPKAGRRRPSDLARTAGPKAVPAGSVEAPISPPESPVPPPSPPPSSEVLAETTEVSPPPIPEVPRPRTPPPSSPPTVSAPPITAEATLPPVPEVSETKAPPPSPPPTVEVLEAVAEVPQPKAPELKVPDEAPAMTEAVAPMESKARPSALRKKGEMESKTEPNGAVQEFAEEWLQDIRQWPKLSGRKRGLAMRNFYLRLTGTPDGPIPGSIQAFVLDNLGDLLNVPVDGATLVMNYAIKLKADERTDVVGNLIPLLADPQGSVRANAFEALRILVPYLPDGQQILLQKKLKDTYEKTSQWNYASTMVHQARLYFESPIRSKPRLPRPTF